MAPLCAISLDTATKKSYITVMVYWFYISVDELNLFRHVVQKYQLSHVEWKVFRSSKKHVGWKRVGPGLIMERGEYTVIFRTKQERDHVEMIYKMMKGDERTPVALAA